MVEVLLFVLDIDVDLKERELVSNASNISKKKKKKNKEQKIGRAHV